MHKVSIMAFLMFVPLLLTPGVEARELPDYLYSKGGVIYPSTGDSTQTIFRTQPEVMEYLEPGMLVGVLPTDCNSVSHGSVGEIFICHYDLVLKPEEKNGETVYRVITLD